MRSQMVFVLCCIGILALFYGVGCSEQSSNTDSTTTEFFPTLDFALPSTIVSSSAVRAQSGTVVGAVVGQPENSALGIAGSNVLTRWAFRIDRIINFTNTVLTRLNEKGVTAASGTFTKELAGGTIKGQVAEIVNNANYNHLAIICLDDQKSLYIEWSTDGSKVHFIRDFKVDPAATGNTTDLKTEITYLESSDTTIELNVYGTPWKIPADVSNSADGGDYLGEYVYATRGSDGNFTIKGVNAWESAERTSATAADAFVGDAFGTGKLNSDGSGDFLIYRVFSTLLCGSITFDPADTDSPGWCYSGSFDNAGSITYSILNLSSLWSDTALKPIGIAQDSSVKVVDFPSMVSCPQ